jgi:hypothetical protein
MVVLAAQDTKSTRESRFKTMILIKTLWTIPELREVLLEGVSDPSRIDNRIRAIVQDALDATKEFR